MGSGGDQVSAAVGGAGGVAGVQPMPCAPFIGPDLQHPMVDVYSTLPSLYRSIYLLLYSAVL